jgi:glycosyltransferase involved in cell wall biosynthesis
MSPRISVIIPTQRRPKGLALAARSICHQTGLPAGDIELVIVDNDQCPSARALTAELAAEAPVAVHYVHEPATGVVNARNAGLAKAEGGLIAFLDDDEEAPAGWLAQMVAAQAAYEADVVFGPVRARAPDAVREHRAYLETFFSREGPARSGPIDRYYGCGNSLIRRAALPDWNAPFSMRRNLIGGEDDLLFGGMSEAGARFDWAADAVVWEDPVPERLTLGYTIRRAFAYGQGPSEHCAIGGDRVGVAFWMMVGLVQATAFGLVAAVQWVARTPGRAAWLDRAARGLGKTLWWGPFKIQFYGRTA